MRLRQPAVASQVEARLDEGRIAEQGQHAAEVARGIEKIGIAGGRMARAREPLLDERRGGADYEERQPDGE